jgi:hypothetical protein
MTQIEALQALEALTLLPKNDLRKVYKNSKAYQTAVEAVSNPGQPVICGQHKSAGKFSGSDSWQYQTALILTRANIRYTTANVAPKGGKAGDRITVNF